jgi:hypothetical protein
MSYEMQTERDVQNRLARIESRVVEGFQQLGVNVKQGRGIVVANHEEFTAAIPATNVSLIDVLRAIKPGEDYEIYHNGKRVCYVCAEEL